MIDDVALRARTVPGWIRAPLVLLPLGLALYSCFGYVGPYRWLAEWQLDLFDGYEVVLTGLVVCALALLPSVVAIQVLASFWPTDQETTDSIQRAMATEEAQLRQRFPWIFGLALFAMAATATGYFGFVALRVDTELAEVDARDLERGETPSSRYVELSGTALTDEAYGVTESSGGGTKVSKLYVPVYSKRALSKKRRPPASVFIAIREADAQKFEAEIARGKLRGILRENGLPGMVRAELERQGDDDADERWILSFHDTPDRQWTMAAVFGSVTGFVAMLLGVGWFVRRRRLGSGSRPR